MPKSKKGKHQSTGKKLKHSLIWLESFDIVEKVVLNISESCRTAYAPGHLRCTKNVSGGIKLVGHSDNGITNIFVKVADENREELLTKIEKKFP